MPIRPENKDRYPSNWPEIRRRILLRALGCREFCGVPNKTKHPITGSLVVLTIAHLDHQPENCDDENLRALCQRCHNRYDAPVRAANIKIRHRHEIEIAGQKDIFKQE
jgi:5-methylcytosine-specific restriction endonuclease McrA